MLPAGTFKERITSLFIKRITYPVYKEDYISCL